jgi:hypothetical protein
MIVRIDINFDPSEGYSYSVIAEHQTLYDGNALSSIVSSLAAAVEGLSSDVGAAEISFGGIVSGTYPLTTIATRPHDVAEHAVNTTNAVNAALQER